MVAKTGKKIEIDEVVKPSEAYYHLTHNNVKDALIRAVTSGEYEVIDFRLTKPGDLVLFDNAEVGKAVFEYTNPRFILKKLTPVRSSVTAESLGWE